MIILGFCAEFCAVTAIEEDTKKAVDFSVVQKNEVGGVSGRMEVEGVKRCLDSIKQRAQIQSVTVDKHSQVVAYLRNEGYEFFLDLYHVLHNTKKQIRGAMKEMKSANDKNQLAELGRRFILHVYASLEMSNGPEICKERVYSFFLHVQGIHRWDPAKFDTVIRMESAAKQFHNSSFVHVLECPHELDNFEGRHEPIDANSNAFKKLLEIVTKKKFMDDLAKLRHECITSYVESFHSVCIHYRPKRKFFPRKGFEIRTMLAALAFNENRSGEWEGKRTVREIYECYSKAKRANRVKRKMGPVIDEWKSEIVSCAIAKKQNHGPGKPTSKESDQISEFDDDVELEDALSGYLNDALHISSSDDDDE